MYTFMHINKGRKGSTINLIMLGSLLPKIKRRNSSSFSEVLPTAGIHPRLTVYRLQPVTVLIIMF